MHKRLDAPVYEYTCDRCGWVEVAEERPGGWSMAYGHITTYAPAITTKITGDRCPRCTDLLVRGALSSEAVQARKGTGA